MAKTLGGMCQNRYRIELDEAFAHEKYGNKKADRRWYERIPLLCGGHIYLYQENPVILKAWSPKLRRTFSKLYQQYKDQYPLELDTCFEGFEAELTFPAALLMEVAEAARARKKRRLSEAHKEVLRQRAKATQFGKRNHGSKTAQTA